MVTSKNHMICFLDWWSLVAVAVNNHLQVILEAVNKISATWKNLLIAQTCNSGAPKPRYFQILPWWSIAPPLLKKPLVPPRDCPKFFEPNASDRPGCSTLCIPPLHSSAWSLSEAIPCLKVPLFFLGHLTHNVRPMVMTMKHLQLNTRFWLFKWIWVNYRFQLLSLT